MSMECPKCRGPLALMFNHVGKGSVYWMCIICSRWESNR